MLVICQVRERLQTKQFTHVSSETTLNYNFRTMCQVWEDFKLPLTPSDNFCNDSKISLTVLQCGRAHSSAAIISKDETVRKHQDLQSASIPNKRPSEHENLSPDSIKRRETKKIFFFTAAIASMLPRKV